MDDKQPMVFEDLPIGEEFADEYVLTPDLARDYAEGIEDANPWYLEHSPFGGPVANPMLIVAQHARLFKTKYHHGGKCAYAPRDPVSESRAHRQGDQSVWQASGEISQTWPRVPGHGVPIRRRGWHRDLPRPPHYHHALR